MHLQEFIRKVRLYTRLSATNANPDSVIKEAVNDAYHQLLSKYTTKYPLAFVETYDLTLTALFTPLPQHIRSAEIVRVETRNQFSSANSQNEFNELLPVDGSEMASAPRLSYVLINETIRLPHLDFDGRTVRLWYRPRLPRLEAGEDEPSYIPERHQDAIMWLACVLVQVRDGGATDHIATQAKLAELRMFAGMQRPSNVFRN